MAGPWLLNVRAVDAVGHETVETFPVNIDGEGPTATSTYNNTWIATVPEALFFQLFKHPLTDAGLAQFAKDWEKVPK